MPAPFVVRVLSDDARAAHALAQTLRAALAARRAQARVETGARELPGTVADVAVIAPDGTPRWLAPLDASGDPHDATARLLAFLGRWGFIPAEAAPHAVGARAASA